MKKTLHQLITGITIIAGCFSFSTATAQVSLGDIAFTGYHGTPNAPQNDAFSFVILKNIASGTVINFTDNAWGNDNVFKTTEQTIVFTTGTNYAAGTEFHLAGQPNTTPATVTTTTGPWVGTCTGNMLSLSINGDQVFAYTGSAAAPTFISAIHMNVYVQPGDGTTTTAAVWDNAAAASQTANGSFKPAALTTGTDCIWIGTQGSNASERNNARFSCSKASAGGANLATAAGIRAAVNNQAFWDAESAATGATPTWALPSGCNFFSVVPIKLLNFDGQKTFNGVDLQWQTTDLTSVDHFELQRKFDNGKFETIKTISAQHGAGNLPYNYHDGDAFKACSENIFYQLRMTNTDGSVELSSIVPIKNSNMKGMMITGLQNPTSSSSLNFNIASPFSREAFIQVTDLSGKEIMKRKMMLKAGENPVNLSLGASGGLYIINLVTTQGERISARLIKN